MNISNYTQDYTVIRSQSVEQAQRAHEKRLKALRRFLIAELKTKPDENLVIVLPRAPKTLESLIPQLVAEVNRRRILAHLKPYSFVY